MRVGHVLEISDHHLEISDHHFKVEVVLVKLGWGWFGVKVTKRPRLTSLYLHRPDLVLIPRHAGGIQKYGKYIHFIKFSPLLLESGRSRLFSASSTLSCLFQQKERDKAEVSTSRGGTGACCLRPWLTRNIV